MKVLSLFDGMSCGQIALRNIGADIEAYYASEVDKYAIQTTQLNFPETIQLGNVEDIDARTLGHIDLLIGGSPCQSFSFAGKRNGMSTVDQEEIYTLERYLEVKKAGFQFVGQSYLFWEYMRILEELREVNPDVKFLLENVEMDIKWERVISEAIGMYGVHINSALVSAQNRKRIYWTNIRTRTDGLFGDLHSDIPLPEDRHIYISDILDKDVPEKYYVNKETVGHIVQRLSTLDPVSIEDCVKLDKKGNIKQNQSKASCFTAGGHSGGNHSDMDIIAVREGTSKGYVEISKGECFNALYPTSTTRRGRKIDGGRKTSPLMASNFSCMLYDGIQSGEVRLRRFTPSECARLQTVPEWYRWNVSESQQYKMLGNGWTVDIISHILNYLIINKNKRIMNATKRTDLFLIDPRNIEVVSGFNVRRDFDLDELKEQIKANGVLNPVTVLPFKDENGVEKYKLVDGERRYRATMLAIEEGADIQYVKALKAPRDASLEQLYIEQMMRNEGKRFSEYECAIMFQRFKDEFGYTQVEIAQKFKKSPAYISKCLSLLDLPSEILDKVLSGELSAVAAKEIVSSYATEKEQVNAAREIVKTAKSEGRSTATNKQVMDSLKDANDAKAVSAALRKVWAYLDGENTIDIDKMARLLDKYQSIDKAVKEYKKKRA